MGMLHGARRGAAVLSAWLATASVALAATPGPQEDFVLTAGGDAIIMTRLTGEQDNPRFRGLVDLIRQGDAAFVAVEQVFPSDKAYPAATSGDTYMGAPPYTLSELQNMGFNLFAAANNHTYDFGLQGVIDTIEVFKDHGAVYAGIGMTLGEARQAGYLDSRRGRVAVISTTSSFGEEAAAGDPRPDMRGRPGLNPLRFDPTYRVDKATFDALSALKDRPGVAGNAERRRDPTGEWGLRADRPTGGPPTVAVGGRTYELSETPGATHVMVEHDLKAITRNIAAAKARSNYVVTYIHSHEGGGRPAPQNPALGRMTHAAPFITDFAHAAIDAGTDAFFANGSHTVRGIEIYKGRPIFYGLGDLFLQNDLVAALPTEFYNRYELGPDTLPAEALSTRGSYNDPVQYETAVVRVGFRGGAPREVAVHPVQLRLKTPGAGIFGVPMLADAAAAARILGRIQTLSQAYGTTMTIRNGVGYIAIP
jgi:poly-gamma-glutamate capsule biosynthesis protein CapA/YwtB (metallophosphatase superfamily)